MLTGTGPAMPATQTTSAFASEPSVSAPGTARRERLRRWLRNGPNAERRTLMAVGGVILTVWLVVIFGRAIADSNSLAQRQAQEELVNAQLRAQVAAGRSEIAFFQTEPFLRFESRADGFGEPGERIFALAAGAPSPKPITPLGADHPVTDVDSPLDNWLHLLFGN
jgi:hypothetical protein